MNWKKWINSIEAVRGKAIELIENWDQHSLFPHKQEIVKCICISGNVCVSFQGGTVVKNLPASAGDARDGSTIPGWGRFPGVGSDNPLQYFCLETPMDRGTWQVKVHGVAISQKQLSNWTHEMYVNNCYSLNISLPSQELFKWNLCLVRSNTI